MSSQELRNIIENAIATAVEQVQDYYARQLRAAMGQLTTAIKESAPNGHANGHRGRVHLAGLPLPSQGPLPSIYDANKPTKTGKGNKRPPQLLETTKAKFRDFVKDNPGLRIEQINAKLGTTTKELALPIRKLIAEKKIRTKGEKRSTQYFV